MNDMFYGLVYCAKLAFDMSYAGQHEKLQMML